MEHVDVLVVGAGLSGIAAGYYLQAKCPRRSYAIVERRSTLGGTWDLFRYPGVRSDSEMFTLGYSFNPWSDPKAIVDGQSIVTYLADTARKHGIDRRIRFGSEVAGAQWSSSTNRWVVQIRDASSGASRQLSCNFLWCAVAITGTTAATRPSSRAASAFGPFAETKELVGGYFISEVFIHADPLRLTRLGPLQVVAQ